MSAKRLTQKDLTIFSGDPERVSSDEILRLIAHVRAQDEALALIEAHLLDWYGESKIVEFCRAARMEE